MRLLLPAVQGLLVLLTALEEEHVNDLWIRDVTVLLKLLAHSGTDLRRGDVEGKEGADLGSLARHADAHTQSHTSKQTKKKERREEKGTLRRQGRSTGKKRSAGNFSEAGCLFGCNVWKRRVGESMDLGEAAGRLDDAPHGTSLGRAARPSGARAWD